MDENSTLKIEIESIKKVNYCLVHNGLKVISFIKFINESENVYKNLKVNVKFEPEFSSSYSFEISFIDKKQSIIETKIDSMINFDYLYNLNESFKASIIVEVANEHELISTTSKEIEVLTFDQWDGNQVAVQYLSSFILPNDEINKMILKNAETILCNNGALSSFDGYSSNDKSKILNEVAAIYYALLDENIFYATPKPSFEISGQKVRLPAEIFKTKFATCLDSSLLFCGLCELAGLNSIIILIDNHAYCGVWLIDENYPNVIIDDKAYIENKVKGHEIILIETTLITSKIKPSFDDAIINGNHNLNTKSKTFTAIDVKSARASQIKPLPIKSDETGNYVIFNQQNNSKQILDYKIDDINIIDKKINKDRFDIWEKKLLDLSSRNKLVSFIPGNQHYQIFTYDIYKFFSQLLKQNLSIYSEKIELYKELIDKIYDTNFEQNKSIFENDFNNQRVRLLVSEKRLPTIVRSLMQNAKTSIEESGSNTLFISCGTLIYIDKGKTRYAPIILVPIDIYKNNTGKNYSVSFRDDEILINNTLFEYLKANYDLSFDELRELPYDKDSDTYDLKAFFNTLRKKITGFDGWTVSETSFIGIFSFTRFIMWNDLRNRKDDLLKNDIVKSLVDNTIPFKNKVEAVNPKDLDLMLAPNKYAIPLMADSSQTEAIVDASRGLSFVLNGPPGTGKSQTITNMIINSLYNKKTVLFVAQKMAALEVVKKRLDETGLGVFCIELHSNKAQKSDVLNQIKKILDLGKLKTPEEYDVICAQLLETRNELNNDLRKLHKPSDKGFDLYENILNYEKYKDSYKNICLTGIDYNLITKESYLETINAIDNFKKIKEGLGDKYIKLFSPIELEEYSISLRNELKETLEQYSLSLFANQTQNSLVNKDTDFALTRDNLLKLYHCINYKKNNSQSIANTYTSSNDENSKLAIQSLFMDILSNDFAYQIYKKYFKSEILTLDLNTLYDDYKSNCESGLAKKIFLIKNIKEISLNKKIYKYLKEDIKFNEDEMLKFLLQLKSIKKSFESLKTIKGTLIGLFGTDWKDEDTNIEDLAKKITVSNEYKKLLNSVKANNIGLIINNIEVYGIDKYLIQVDTTLSIEELLKSKFNLDVSKLNFNNFYVEMREYIEQLKSNLEKIKEYILFNNERKKLESMNVGNLIKLSLSNSIQDSELINFYKKEINYNLAIRRISSDDDLNLFSGLREDEKIEKYRELINKYNVVTLQEVAARLSKSTSAFFHNDNTSLANEYVILNKAISNGGRGISLRNLFDSIPNILRMICPCFLMSPLSVAQYLDPKNERFDIVIFDEASQITTSDAIGAIARGKSAIVVGDEKQLPPTSFFQANTSDEDDFFIEDGESVLMDCLNISMPKKYLAWHYRSKDESLIAFSNANYYDNKLLTFPSPNSINGAISYHFVSDGIYENRKNKREADEIVKEVKRRLKDPELSKKSIGIVTFSIAQQSLIEEKINEALRKDSTFEKAFYSQKEELFVKNLENVQGDERDVIIFSICYGPAKDGRVSLNFGPLSTNGGEKRLNVAVSRAREEMVVFTSLRSEMIDLSRAQNLGSRGLREFLEYARRGKNYILIQNGTQKEYKTGIEQYIANDLNKRGYKTQINVGTSDFRVDIGIIDPNNENKFILGVLCDSKSYIESNTAKDRNVTQKAVLNGLGWKIIRIWSLDYFDSPNYVVDKIIEAINSVNETSDCFNEIIPHVTYIKSSDNLDIFHSIDYVATNYIKDQEDSSNFYEFPNDVKSVCEFFIRNEGPISENLLCKKVLRHYGILRNTKQTKELFYKILLYFKTTYTGQTAFYWTDELQYLNISKYRVGNDDRDFNDIPKEEMLICISDIMKKKLSLTEEELYKEMVNSFGFSKVTDVNRKICEYGVQYAIEKQVLRKDDNSYYYVSQ